MTNSISIIIPVRNESETLPDLLIYLFSLQGQEFLKEIIVSDGMSSDESVAIAAGLGVKVIMCQRSGRGYQMNEGSKNATGTILYFLHADSRPPVNFIFEIIQQVNAGIDAGCFRLKFDHDHWFLRTNAWFTRFNVNAVRFGDQSLFIRKDSFMKIGGFREDLIIMEDQEIVSRIKAHGKFNVIPGYVLTSARKYRVNGIFRMQAIFFYIYFSYRLGMSQSKLVNQYRKLIRSA